MKRKCQWIMGLVVLGFVVTGLFFALAPQQIPVHYGISGQADRWGSKYEFIVLPVISLLFAGFMVWLAHREGSQGREMNQKVVLGMSIWCLLLFQLIWLIFMGMAIRAGHTDVQPSLSWRVFLILLHAAQIPLGNKMPKAQRNGAFGLRTKWSMANDRCWQKSQRFGGHVLVWAGLMGAVVCAFVPEGWLWQVTLLLFTATPVVCVLGSRRLCRGQV